MLPYLKVLRRVRAPLTDKSDVEGGFILCTEHQKSDMKEWHIQGVGEAD